MKIVELIEIINTSSGVISSGSESFAPPTQTTPDTTSDPGWTVKQNQWSKKTTGVSTDKRTSPYWVSTPRTTPKANKSDKKEIPGTHTRPSVTSSKSHHSATGGSSTPQRANKTKNPTNCKPKNTWADTCEEIDKDEEMDLEATRKETPEPQDPLVTNKRMNHTPPVPAK